MQIFWPGECVLPMNLQTICLHSELTGNPNKKSYSVHRRHLAWLPRYWLFFSGHNHAWGKAPHPGCMQRGKIRERVSKLNSVLLADSVLRKSTKVTSLTPTQSQQVQFSSVQLLSHVGLWDPMNRSMPGLLVHHRLLEFTQTHVHWVGDAIQPSHLLSSPSPPAPNPSQHQGLFQWVNSLHEVAKVLEFQI